ncbi:MAG: pentapeptide repeat-containing protein [Gammaproteobacteria bacterium]
MNKIEKQKCIKSFWFKYIWSWDCMLFVLIALMIITIVFYDIESQSLFSRGLKHGLGLETKKEILYFLGLASSGVIVLMSTLALRSRAESQDKIAKAQKETAEAQKETAVATLEANQQDIFESGITNLGHESESVRLGGIYTLYELAARESGRTQNIVEILCAHLRAKTQEPEYQKDFEGQPSNEIASLLLLLTGEKSKALKAKAEYRLDFAGAYLKGVYLSGAQLQRADLSGAELQGANLSVAELQGALFIGAGLQKIRLSRALLQGARFGRAELQGADLEEAQLQRAGLSGVELQGANLTIAELQGADLSYAQLQGANLSGAQLQGANLSEAQLHGANLSEAQLQESDLSHAQLQGAYAGVLDWGDDLLPIGNDVVLEDVIIDRTGKQTELSTAVFSGGLSTEYITQMIKLHKQAIHNSDDFLEQMGKHAIVDPYHTLPEDTITGILSQKMADKIIADYRKAMKDVPAWRL